MDSLAIDQWCHTRRLIRLRGKRVDMTMDYPVTLEIARYDAATRRDWFLAEIELIAHIGPGPGHGWALESWSYQGSIYHHEAPHPRLEHHAFKTHGTDPLDQAIAERLLKHLLHDRARVDAAWEEHKREREGWLKDRAYVRSIAAE
jgi:hypothetical protein